MLHLDNPAAVFVVFALFAAGLVVYPLIRTERLRVAPSKIVALVIAAGICVYSGAFAVFLALLWPLSFIWFPEYWGAYRGFIFRGQYIDEESPPILIAWIGWLFLIVFPLFLAFTRAASIWPRVR